MKKKIYLFLIIFVCIFTIVLIYKNKDNKLNGKIVKEERLSIMIKEEGAVEYTKSSSKEIPKGDYTLNEEKSHCENNGKVTSYDNVNGKISFSFIGSDRCYLYFDKITATPITTLISTSTPDVYEENGLRYEGADPNNYICFDSNKEGTCSNSSLLFRIIGLFDEEYSLDGTNSAGTKKLLKVLDTNNYGGDSGKKWNDGTNLKNASNNSTTNKNKFSFLNNNKKYKTIFLVPPVICSGNNDWSESSLKIELNEIYLNTLLSLSEINDKFENALTISKWHLGGANNPEFSGDYGLTYNMASLITEDYYKIERPPYATSGELMNLSDGNAEYVYAKVGLMYPSDYGYASTGGGTTNKESCRSTSLYNWSDSSYSDCKNNDWIYNSQNLKNEWLISHDAIQPCAVMFIASYGYVLSTTYGSLLYVRPTFYLDATKIKIVGGSGTSSDPYHIG